MQTLMPFVQRVDSASLTCTFGTALSNVSHLVVTLESGTFQVFALEFTIYTSTHKTWVPVSVRLPLLALSICITIVCTVWNVHNKHVLYTRTTQEAYTLRNVRAYITHKLTKMSRNRLCILSYELSTSRLVLSVIFFKKLKDLIALP